MDAPEFECPGCRPRVHVNHGGFRVRSILFLMKSSKDELSGIEGRLDARCSCPDRSLQCSLVRMTQSGSQPYRLNQIRNFRAAGSGEWQPGKPGMRNLTSCVQSITLNSRMFRSGPHFLRVRRCILSLQPLAQRCSNTLTRWFPAKHICGD
jgi:hypothetical protein